jgi:hypothetical protein
MARHNREGSGTDQHDNAYTISYQPDWLGQVKVTRLLPTGRQSTKTLFTSPDRPERQPGRQIRTGIRSAAGDIAFEIALTDPDRVIRRVIVETGPGTSEGVLEDGDIQFTIDRHD